MIRVALVLPLSALALAGCRSGFDGNDESDGTESADGTADGGDDGDGDGADGGTGDDGDASGDATSAGETGVDATSAGDTGSDGVTAGTTTDGGGTTGSDGAETSDGTDGTDGGTTGGDSGTTGAGACANTCSGCCLGESCLGGDMELACGANGNTCMECRDWENCGVADCEIDTTYVWDLVAAAASIGDTGLDSGGCASNYGFIDDPYVEVTLNGIPGATNAIEDDLTPAWGETVLSVAASVYLGNLLNIELWDADCCCDPTPDQIDSCSYQITEDDLRNGSFTIATCGTYTTDLTFNLNPT